jgi:hypothetical protein
MRKAIVPAVAVLLVWSAAASAQSGEFFQADAPAYGYAVMIPAEFSADGAISGTTAWTAASDLPAAPDESADTEEKTPLVIWIARAPVGDADPQRLFDIDRKLDLAAASEADAAISEVTAFAVEGGYGYWYKEADKANPADFHRWIAKVYGNGGIYVLCFAGPFSEFGTWGPVFEQVIGSFRLVPLK